MDAWYSLGLQVSSDGALRDVLFYSPAYKAGLGPGMKIIAVNGREYTDSLMHDAIRDSKTTQTPIELIIENTGYYRTVKIDYHGGERYPHLERVNAKAGLARSDPAAFGQASAAIEASNALESSERSVRRTDSGFVIVAVSGFERSDRSQSLRAAQVYDLQFQAVKNRSFRAACRRCRSGNSPQRSAVAVSPPDSSHGRPRTAALREAQADVTLLHDARGSGDAHAPGEKNRFVIFHSIRRELLQPALQRRRQFIERQLRVAT